MARGKFITLEGGEGSGKSTQRDRLAARLRDKGIDVVTTREPGGAPGAEIIRGLLVDGDPGRWEPGTEALLHFAARNEHVRKTVEPALAAGRWVISDRFADSTMAYQGAGQGVGRDMIMQLYEITVGGLKPDLTLILDLPSEVGLARAKARMAEQRSGEDRYERMDPAFHEKLRTAFLEIAEREPERCAIIDATADIPAVEAALWAAVADRFRLEVG